jgi:hypothetical protein
MSKTALLQSTAVDVVKSSEKLPAPRPKREYADFDAFVANADKLVGFFNSVSRDIERLDDLGFQWLEWPYDRHWLDLDQAKKAIERAKIGVQTAKYALWQFPQARKRLAEFKRDEKWYNRKELYDIKGKGKKAQWTLSRRVVAEQIGLLLASFQNSRPGTPKVFGKMVVEEVYANSPNACELESACRHVRRNQNFPPSIAEMLKAIKSESKAWCDRWEMLGDNPEDDDADDYWQRRLKEAIAEADSTIGKAQAKLAEFAAEEVKREAAREARERERKEAEERARAEREAKAAEQAAEVERRNEEWDRKWRSANACREVHTELWDAVLLDLSPKMAAQDAETMAALHEAGGFVFYVAQLVRARLLNAAMPKRPEADGAMGC